jgi:seryl-tRNA synthetase
MIDLKALRTDTQSIYSALKKKGAEIDVDELLELDDQRKEYLQRVETLRRTQNEANQRIAQEKDPQKKSQLIAEMKSVADEAKIVGDKLERTEATLEKLLLAVPNPPHESVPAGKDDTENVQISTWGTPRNFEFKPKDHLAIGTQLGIIDTERGAKVSGSRFYYLKGDGFLLHRAIQELAFQTTIAHGYIPLLPPILVNRENLVYTGMFPGEERETFRCEEDEKYLIGTSEIPGVGYHAGEVLKEIKKGQPLKYVLFSPCFRREAGSYGKDTKGILRVHQFDKVEMVVFCHPDDSLTLHEELRGIEEEITQALGLPYQVMNICGGDLGAPAAKKYDLEAWFPSQLAYREITSTSNCTDFQARRAKIRCIDENGETRLVHTLNGTAVSTRPLIAVLENYQNADGSVEVPEALRKWMGKEKINTKLN